MKTLEQERVYLRASIIDVAEMANEKMFRVLYPNIGVKINPFGPYGLDAATKFVSVEEWKFNSGPHDRLYNNGYAYLIEEKKFDELKQKADSYGCKPIMRKYFEDAVMIIDLSEIEKEDLVDFYNGNYYMEKNQYSNDREKQAGFYVPYGYWRIQHYTPEEQGYYYEIDEWKKTHTLPFQTKLNFVEEKIRIQTAQKALDLLNFLHQEKDINDID